VVIYRGIKFNKIKVYKWFFFIYTKGEFRGVIMVALELFWTFFIGTWIVMRSVVTPLHIRGKTPTHFLRKRTNKDIHHIHLGFFFLLVAILVFLIQGVGYSGIALSAISLSFIADEIFLMPKPGTKEALYFGNKGLVLSVISHVIIGLLASVIIVFYF